MTEAPKIRILIEVDGVQTPILFPDVNTGNMTEDPQLSIFLNNIDDAVRDALRTAGWRPASLNTHLFSDW